MNVISSGSDYVHDGTVPDTAGYLYKPIVDFCAEKRVTRVLDIGCGGGSLARCLIDHGIEVVGMDPSESGVEAARGICPEGKFYCAGVYDAPDVIAEQSFDAVIATEVIEHLFYPRELLRFANKKLHPPPPPPYCIG
jgi:2-polyprenyl-3-methyl-5-hydroxy-6-metoxy-1,4-benzoquinol methylase